MTPGDARNQLAERIADVIEAAAPHVSVEDIAGYVLDDLLSDVPLLMTALDVKQEGFCPRGNGHYDSPYPDPDDPEGRTDYGACGSKWTHVRFVMPWQEVQQ